MSAYNQVMQVVNSHHISNQLLKSENKKHGGLLSDGRYAWFASEANIFLYSKHLGSVVSSKSFAENSDKSIKITFVKELNNHKETCNLLLVGCSFKTSGILFICQLPTLTTIRCIEIPNPVSFIGTIINEFKDQFCDEFKIMSTVLLVGLTSGAVYAIDLRQDYIEKKWKRNEVVVNESKPSKLFIIRKNEDCQEVKEMSDDSDCHLGMFLNENFYAYCKKQYSGKLNFSVSSLLYIEEINTIAIGYSTGHFQLWDCKIMRTIFLLKEPKCVMPITHITFLEPSDDPNNLCYLWVIQSDNTRLPTATMIALTYDMRLVMPNGSLSYRDHRGSGIKLEMSLKRETGIGRCISALSLCNVNLVRNETDMDEDCEIRLCAMFLEVRRNVGNDPESYIFLFDINQWYKAQMPSTISHLKVSNSYACFVKLPLNISYLDFNISDKTLRPFGYNFKNNVEELYYPSSIYFECECLVDSEIITFKHAGVQQEILDQLLTKNWRILLNPALVFSQCIQTNLKPFFWDKSDDYGNYNLPDQRSFVISILVEHKMMTVLRACAEEWKNGTYVSSEATILHLVQCLWKHVMVVKQFADKLCVPLFDCSGTQLDKKNKRILNHCLSQMQCIKFFLEDLHKAYGVHIINVDYSYRVYTLNLVTQYFKAVMCFLNYGLLPESLEEDHSNGTVQYNVSSLIQYANKRRAELKDKELYLIDAIVINEPKRNKLIEQWLHEGGEATKGMYPPSNVQCLLRIYLNAALSEEVKNFITIYFLIDVCSSQEMNVTVANRMCNFALEFDVQNKGLNTLCRASWLFDHDMFEEAMEVLTSNKEWMIVDEKSWDWFHWAVLKLLVVKSEYYWARFYLKLVNMNVVNIDDHKFCINIFIMNDQCFEALDYIRAKSLKEKPILFEYCFDRCNETNKLKCLIEYLWELEEEELFFSYLKRLKDSESICLQLLFLLQRGRYIEASKINKSLEGMPKLKLNDGLTISNILVNRFDKSIPVSLRQKNNIPPFKSLYKKTEIALKCMNTDDSKMFNIMNKKNDSILNKKMLSSLPSSSIDLLPSSSNNRKRSPKHDVVINEKRRKINEDNILSPPKVVNELIPNENKALEILKTPLVEKSIASPSATRYSSILKTGSAKKHKRILSIKNNDEPVCKTVLRFSLPGNNVHESEESGVQEGKDMPVVKNNENKSFYNVNTNDINDLVDEAIQPVGTSLSNIQETIDLDSSDSILEVDVRKESDENEKMDISEELSSDNHEQNEFEVIQTISNELKNKPTTNTPVFELTSDEEDDQEPYVKNIILENKNPTINADNKYTKLETSTVNESKWCKPVNDNNFDQHSLNENLKVIDTCILHSDKEDYSDNESHSYDDNIEDQIASSNSGSESLGSNQVYEQHSDDENSDTEDKGNVVEDKNEIDEEVDDEIYDEDFDEIYDEIDDEDQNETDDEDQNEIDDEDVVEIDDESVIEIDVEGVAEIDDEGVVEIVNEDVIEIDDENDVKIDEDDIEEIKDDDDDDGGINNEDQNKINDEHKNDINDEIDNEDNDESEVASLSSEDDLKSNSNNHSTIDDDSDFEKTRYGRFKFQNDERIENYDEESEEIEEEEVELQNERIENYDEESEEIEEEEVGSEHINLVSSDDEKQESLKDIAGDNIEKLDDMSDEESEENYSDHYSIENDNESEENNSEHVADFDKKDDSNLSQHRNESNEDFEQHSTEFVVDDEESDLEQTEFKSDECNENNSEEENDKRFEETDLKQNNITFNKDLETVHTSENKESQNDDDMGNTPSRTFDLTEINSSSDVGDTTSENYNINYKAGEVIDSTLKDEVCVNNDSDKADKYIELEKVDEKNEAIQEYVATDKNICLEMSRKKSSPIPDDSVNRLTTIETESKQPVTVETDNNQLTSFVFGEPFFGQQEVSDKKPMLLFGQVYSFENEHFVADSSNKKSKTDDMIVDNQDEVIDNKESEVEVVEDIQDILELESLPESNPDENLDEQVDSKSTSSKGENCETLCDDGQYVVLSNNSNYEGIKNVTAVPGNKSLIYETNVDLSSKNYENNKSTSNEICDSTNNVNLEIRLNNKESDAKIHQEDFVNVKENKIEVLSCDVVHDKTTGEELFETQNPRIININNESQIDETKVDLSSKSHKLENEESTNNAIGSNPVSDSLETEILINNEGNNVKIHQVDNIGAIENKTEVLLCNAVGDKTTDEELLETQNLVKINTNHELHTENHVYDTNIELSSKSHKLKNEESMSTAICCNPINTKHENEFHLKNHNSNVKIDQKDVFDTIENKTEVLTFNAADSKTTDTILLESQNLEVSNINNKLRRSIRATSEQKQMNQKALTQSKRAKSIASCATNEKSNIIDEKNLALDFNRQQTNNNSFVAFTKDSQINKSQKQHTSNIDKTTMEELESVKTSIKDPETKTEDKLVISEVKRIRCRSEENVNVHSPIKPHIENKSMLGITIIEQSSNKKTLRRSLRAKSEQPLATPFIENNLKSDNTEKNKLDEGDLKTIKKGNQSIIDYQLNTQGSQKVYNLRASSRTKDSLGVTDNALQKNTPSENKNKPSTSKAYINEHIDNGKKVHEGDSAPLEDIKKINTRSRTKSESHLNLLDASLLAVFRPPIPEQVRVIIPRKRSNSQEEIAPNKRKSGRSKSLTPHIEQVATRKTAFGLEQIPEEDPLNSNQNTKKIEHKTMTRKSKFNFLSNKTKKVEEDPHKYDKFLHYDTKVKTPRRAKSVQPAPALTLSVVKRREKRSSSVNPLASNESTMSNDNFMKLLTKGLGSPNKLMKRSLGEPKRNKKKQKLTKETKQSATKSDSDNSSSQEELSPIAGDNRRHFMLYTPAKPKKMDFSNSDSEDSPDCSIKSERIVTRATRNTKNIESAVSIDSEQKTSTSTVVSTSTNENKTNLKASARPRRSVSSKPESHSSKKIPSLLPLRKSDSDKSPVSRGRIKNTKDTTIETTINEQSTIELPITSERRITRLQQSILDKSLQSTSTIGLESDSNISVLKSEKKENIKRSKQKKSNN